MQSDARRAHGFDGCAGMPGDRGRAAAPTEAVVRVPAADALHEEVGPFTEVSQLFFAYVWGWLRRSITISYLR